MSHDVTLVWVNSAHEGGRYIAEACRSAQSFRRFIPDAHYLLCTDAPELADSSFDEVRRSSFDYPASLDDAIHLNGQMATKLRVLGEIESERAMYLGSDTIALRPEAASIIDVLDRFDIAVAHAPNRINTSRARSTTLDVPACFPEFNCDLIAWRRSERTVQFLERWRSLYLEDEIRHAHDQGTFRLLAYESDVRIATLPEEFNYRGSQFRPNTVILQRRDASARYQRSPLRRPASSLVAVGNRLLRRLRISARLVSTTP